MGKCQLGMLLELGPQGDVGADNTYGICSTFAQQAHSTVLEAKGVSSLYYNIPADRRHNILGRKHADGWHAQLRIAVHVLMVTEKLCLFYYVLQLQKV